MLLCLDIGSTWTKAALIDRAGRLVRTGQHATTVPEVLDGVSELIGRLDAAGATTLACSSAGGGLRLAVVGQEPLVSAEAGTRVAHSAGAMVVHVSAGELSAARVRALRAARPDVLLLVGGTDGGETRCLLHNARRLAAARMRAPVVLAGNSEVADDALALLRATGRSVVLADNVLPELGRLRPEPARVAIREVYLRHVIGGKGLSRRAWFRRLVRAVTPDAVLGAVAELAAAQPAGGGLMVVDVGGATTDVYTVPDGGGAGPVTAAVGRPAHRRTVEGDLGMRLSATGVVSAARTERLIDAGEVDRLQPGAVHRVTEPGWVPLDDGERAVELRIGTLAALLGARRHLAAGHTDLAERGLRQLVLSGGVFRQATGPQIAAVADALRADPALAPLLRRCEIRLDARYVLAPAGLLAAAGDRAAAAELLRTGLGAPSGWTASHPSR